MLSLAQTIEIVGSMVLTLIFSRKPMQSLSLHDQTRVLDDLDEKIHKVVELVLEHPSLLKVMDRGLNASESGTQEKEDNLLHSPPVPSSGKPIQGPVPRNSNIG